jgi:site-specific DNA-methyltransferase (adenine-specific)
MIILGDCIEKMREIEDESIDLVIADPPYWKVIGEKWDYQWRTEKDNVKWSIDWITKFQEY